MKKAEMTAIKEMIKDTNSTNRVVVSSCGSALNRSSENESTLTIEILKLSDEINIGLGLQDKC